MDHLLEDPEQAIRQAEEILRHMPEDAPRRGDIVLVLGFSLGVRSEKAGSLDDLNRAIHLCQEVTLSSAPGSHRRRAALSVLGDLLVARYRKLNDLEDLEESIRVSEELADSSPTEAPFLKSLGERLLLRFERLKNDNELDNAVIASRNAVAAAPPGHEEREGCLETLRSCLFQRYVRGEARADIEELVPIVEELAREIPPGHPERLSRLINQRNVFIVKNSTVRTTENLRVAIQKAELVLEVVPKEDPERLQHLALLGDLLVEKYKRSDPAQAVKQLTEQLRLYQELLQLALKPLDQAKCWDNISRIYGERSDLSGDMTDVHESIQAAERALDAFPDDGPERERYLLNLANKLHRKFDLTGADVDLDAAMQTIEKSLEALGPESRDRATYAGQFGIFSMRKYERSGDMNYLHQGILRCIDALNAPGSNEEARRMCHDALAGLLRTKYDRTGAAEDLDRAIEAAREALRELPPEHRYYTSRYSNLANILHRRWERRHKESDLDQALSAAERAVANPIAIRADRAFAYHTLSGVLMEHYAVNDSIASLDRAIHAAEKALEFTPPDNAERPRALYNLSGKLLARYGRTGGNIEDLSRCEKIILEAIAKTPASKLTMVLYLENLGGLYFLKFRKSGSASELEEAVKVLKKCWNFPGASPSQRISAARQAGMALMLLAEQAEGDSAKCKWVEASFILREAVELLPSVSPHSLGRGDQQQTIRQFSGLTSLATAASLEAGVPVSKIVESLELGRGVIFGLLFDMRSDVAELRERNAALADEFEKLRDDLDSPVSTSSPAGFSVSSPPGATMQSESTRREIAAKSFNELVKKIRQKVKGLERFLLPPSATELAKAASQGPIVIISVGDNRCDAFIIESPKTNKQDAIRSMALHNLRVQDIKRWANLLRTGLIDRSMMFELLRWLWHTIARPVLDELGIKQRIIEECERQRVWWVPTGPLSGLPIHAAGLYSETGVTTAFDTVLDKVNSSYSPSVKALLYTQRISSRVDRTNASQKVVLVSMEETPSCTALPFAHCEVEELQKLLPGEVTPDVLRKPGKEDVLRAVSGSTVFHFAGHGTSDHVDPLKSALLVSDWQRNKLTVEDLLALKLHLRPPFLAYLSACSTGVNAVDDLLDEGIHLMSACQLVGFQHVIGSLWQVSDRHCVTVAGDVYHEMIKAGMSNPSVSFGLHKAVKLLRDRPGEIVRVRGDRDPTAIRKLAGPEVGLGDPRIWAAYIHIGI